MHALMTKIDKLAVATIATCALTCSALGDDLEMPTFPRGEFVEYPLDTGVQANLNAEAKVAFITMIQAPEAAWIRLYFSQVVLEGASRVRVTSLLDNESQELDAAGMAMWSNSTAYFNGDRLILELIAAPGTRANQLKMTQLAAEFAPPEGGAGQCGICGADDRVSSDEDWSGRLMPVGCTASVYNTCSCLVTAGHCSQGGTVIQFNVPPSLSNCNVVNPPVAEQFPVTGSLFLNGGVGADWSVKTTGVNSLGQTIYQRYGQFRAINPAVPAVNNPASIWGFGVDLTCVKSQTQQLSTGAITSVGATSLQYNLDVRGGNSGSGLMVNGMISGIVTHCNVGCPNLGTRMDRPDFVAARNSLCPCVQCPADVNGDDSVNVGDLLGVVNAWGPCPGPCPPFCAADVTDNCVVNVQDMLAVVNAWGACP